MSAAGDTDRKSDELTPSQINMHITTHKTEGRLSAACFKKKNSSRSPNKGTFLMLHISHQNCRLSVMFARRHFLCERFSSGRSTFVAQTMEIFNNKKTCQICPPPPPHDMGSSLIIQQSRSLTAASALLLIVKLSAFTFQDG